jgi:arylsulfatase A-like enzyme
MAADDGRPWCLHLSYIKPHWPYIVPAPYHALYGGDDVLPVRRSEQERRDPHPVYQAFMDLRVSRNFSRDEVRARVIPAYMGLIKQIDDQLGVLFRFLDERGLSDGTMIVFTSDHGDYLGDHWLGEKDLFHDCSAKIPLIIADPRHQAECERLRGALLDWALRDHNRITMSDARIAPYAGQQQLKSGILIGYWDEAELAEAKARLKL